MQSRANTGRVKAEILPLKRSSVGAAAGSVVADVADAVAVGGEEAAGAAVGEMLASALVGDVTSVTALSTGFMAKRSSSGATLALPSDVAQGSLLGRGDNGMGKLC